MKAILVIDMPTNCMDCPMCQLSDWDGEYHCFGVNSDEVNFKGDKPDWCPLKPFKLGGELQNFRKGIKDKNTLIGFNMAVAICNKYLGENND